MRVFGKSILGLAGAVLSIAGTTGLAKAQQGKFTLPVEAQWGRDVLEPGDYTVQFPTASDFTPLIRVAGNGKSMFVLMQNTSLRHRDEENGELLLANVNGHYVVESISAPDKEKAFEFKASKDKAAAAGYRPGQKPPSIAVQVKAAGR